MHLRHAIPAGMFLLRFISLPSPPISVPLQPAPCHANPLTARFRPRPSSALNGESFTAFIYFVIPRLHHDAQRLVPLPMRPAVILASSCTSIDLPQWPCISLSLWCVLPPFFGSRLLIFSFPMPDIHSRYLDRWLPPPIFKLLYVAGAPQI